MTTNPPPHDQPNTYFVQDRSNLDELTRLDIQDQMLTAGMGGVLAEQADPTSFRRVLDVGCATGNWLIETAKTYPSIPRLIGVDISKRMIDYAQEQAKAAHVDDRVEFAVMDALLILEFPNEYFDLINQRLCASFLRTWEWPKLLSEYRRVTRRGGVIRITEMDKIPESGSAALTRLCRLLADVLYQAGHLFAPEYGGTAWSGELEPLLRKHEIQQVQSLSHVLEYRAGTAEGQMFYEDMSRTFRTTVPFMRRRTRLPDDYDAIYQQMLSDMQQPDFVAQWAFLTAWGQAPGYDTDRSRFETPR
jgi:ubiquinone/menaquinone biosynthesis C-methylase UbiE